MPLAAVAAIAAAGSIASSAIQANAAGDAADAQINALKGIKPVDIGKTAEQAKTADLEKFQTQLGAQEKYDPQSAELRKQGAGAMLTGLAENAGGKTAGDLALAGLGTAAIEDWKSNSPVLAELVARAKEELSAGATLPPEFQAELVRSGLEKAGTAGSSLNANGAAGANLRTLLGSAGLALKQQRLQSAISAMGAADSLQSRRASVLAGIAELDQKLRAGKTNLGMVANTIGTQNVPNIGLSGTDIANMAVANHNQQAGIQAQVGQLQGQKALAQGQMLGSLVQGGSNLLAGSLSSYFNAPSTVGAAPFNSSYVPTGYNAFSTAAASPIGVGMNSPWGATPLQSLLR